MTVPGPAGGSGPGGIALSDGAAAVGDAPVTRMLTATGGAIRALLREGVGEGVEHRRRALEVIERTQLPVAVSEGPAHRLQIANAEWRRMTGYQGPLGVSLNAIFPSLDGHFLGAELARAYHSGRDVALHEVPLATKGSIIRFYSAAILPLRDGAQGAVSGLLAVAADMTAPVLSRERFAAAMRAQADGVELLATERAARTSAEMANRQKDQFLAALSHELRAPLGALLLWAKVLRDDPADPELRRRALDAVQECTLAQSRLVDDLLDISRAISGKLHLELKLIAIENVLQAALEGARAIAAEKGVTLDARFDPGLGQILGDVGRLRQVLQNLLANAVQFTEAGGSVLLSARRTEEWIEIDVRDTGLGIAPEQLPRLFDAFSQVEDSPLSRAHGGLGLGLTIARQLTALHGGSLRASSEGRGRGATFTVNLPIANDDPANGLELSGEPPPQRLRDVRLLLVDDDVRALEPLSLLLEYEGAHLECVSSADAALAALTAAASAESSTNHRLPDVIISDIAMPGTDGDGYSLLRRLRADGPAAARDTPAVALTAFASRIDHDRALAAGFDLHIAKPVDVDKLVTAIHALISARPRASGDANDKDDGPASQT
jgi:signal transduction histidine kinase/DNA-binding NarL/FixJ family response regulator